MEQGVHPAACWGWGWGVGEGVGEGVGRGEGEGGASGQVGAGLQGGYITIVYSL